MTKEKRKTISLFFKTLFCICLTMSACVFFCFGVFAVQGEQRLFDEAELFSESERSELERELDQAIEETGMDFVVVTTEDAQGKSAERYGEDFYIDGNFGTDEEYSGMLFLIDMDNREIFFTPVGKMNYYITDSRRDQILDDAFELVIEEDYAGAAMLAVEDTTGYVRSGIDYSVYPQMDPDYGKKKVTPMEAGVAFAVSFLLAFLPCAGVVREYTKDKNRDGAVGFQNRYRSESHFVMQNSRDHFLGQNVTSVRIESSSSSDSGKSSGGGYKGSNSHSSSGRSFNGGSRKF